MKASSRPFVAARSTTALAVSLLVLGCSDDKDAGADSLTVSGGSISAGSISASGGDGDGDEEDETTGDSNSTDEPRLDMPEEGETDGLPCGEGEFCECEIPPHTPCDNTANTPLVQAMGLNCPGDHQVEFSTNGSSAAIGTRAAFGNAGAFPPQEGSKYVVIGSGRVDELDTAGLLSCSGDLGNYDPGTLPFPLVGTGVGGVTCAEDPTLIGTGDCSNTIEEQLRGSVNDYTDIRITTTVPTTVNSFSYSLAYMSYEYPEWYGSMYNDMYIGWLQSEVWTGNISFDEMGHPISLNAGFLDYRDGTASVYNGTCMQGHAGTKWLTTTAGVKPGETIEIILAIFDMSDSILDSYAFIDNFQWGCEGDQPPSTVPIG